VTRLLDTGSLQRLLRCSWSPRGRRGAGIIPPHVPITGPVPITMPDPASMLVAVALLVTWPSRPR
jgi:hypothetical protein